MRRSQRGAEVAPHLLDTPAVALDEDLLAIGRGLGHHHAERIGDKAVAPELEAMLGRALEADAIHGGDVDAVGDGVAALHGAPGVELSRTVLRLFRRGQPMAVG